MVSKVLTDALVESYSGVSDETVFGKYLCNGRVLRVVDGRRKDARGVE